MGSIADCPIPGGWTERAVAVGSRTFRLLAPVDPDELLHHLQEGSAALPHLADPYWAKLWPAAALLAEAIVREPSPRRKRVLELGCGSGLVGIAALAPGHHVTFSDYVPLAVDLALENAARNGFDQARGLVLDWRRPHEERFEWIVAADVTYDRMHLDPLLDVIGQMLVPGGQALLGDWGRSPAADFVRLATARGWSVSRFDDVDQPISLTEESRLGRYQRLVLARN